MNFKSTYELIHGDCLEILPDIRHELFKKQQKYIIVTDPPFNVGYKYNTYKDRMSEEDYREMLYEIFCWDSAPSVVVHYPEQLYQLAVDMGRPPTRVVSWVYNTNNRRQHRDIAFFGITPDFKRVLQPYKNPSDKWIKRLIANGSMGTPIYDWWNVNIVKNVSKEKTAHPCQMPLQVMKNIIGILPDDYVIIDPFMGSDTTGVVCRQLNRKFIGIELDKEYYEIAYKRISEVYNED